MPLKIAPQYPPDDRSASLAGVSSSGIRCRVWCSPQIQKHPYIWEWTVEDSGGTYEFGREKTEEDAKRESEEARADWQQLIQQCNP